MQKKVHWFVTQTHQYRIIVMYTSTNVRVTTRPTILLHAGVGLRFSMSRTNNAEISPSLMTKVEQSSFSPFTR